MIRPVSLRIASKFVYVAIALSLFACNADTGTPPATGTTTGITSIPNSNPTSSTTSTTSNGGVSCSSDEFCVNVNPPSNSTMVLHQDGNYTQPCNVTSGSDTFCILDADEFDLYDQGLTLSYSVPAGLCSYFEMQPYFYYQYQPGKGPTAVTITINSMTGAVTEADSADGIPNVTGASSTAVGVRTPYTSSPKCTADYTSVGGPNCCYGTYNLTTIQGTTVTTTPQSWGGNPNNCLVGPGVDSQTHFQGGVGNPSNGYPLSSVTALNGSSLSATYTIKSPLKKNFGTNAYIANFWQSGATGDYPLTSDGVGTGSPNAVAGPSAVAGQQVSGCFSNETFCLGNPWYEFECKDAADDLVARIRVLVRSWTSNTEFAAFVSAQNGSPASGTYNLYGTEPAPFADQPIEDIETWVTPQAGAAVGTTGAVNATCYNSGLATQKCGFGSMYPGNGN